MSNFAKLVLCSLIPAAMLASSVDIDGFMIDLTHTITLDLPVPPWWPPYNFTKVLTVNISEGIVAEGYAFSMPEHSGTHIDAPKHFCPNGITVDKISVDRLTGPGAVISHRAKAKNNPDYQVSVADLRDWESVNGQIPKGAILMLDFGWDKFWPNITAIYNSETVDFGTIHHPGLAPEASRWLTTNRKVNAVGTDTPSIDYGQSSLYESHADLCRNGIIIIENVANLGKLPPIGTQIFIGALKLGNGTGTPSRIFAISQSRSGANNLISVPFCVVLPVFILSAFHALI